MILSSNGIMDHKICRNKSSLSILNVSLEILRKRGRGPALSNPMDGYVVGPMSYFLFFWFLRNATKINQVTFIFFIHFFYNWPLLLQSSDPPVPHKVLVAVIPAPRSCLLFSSSRHLFSLLLVCYYCHKSNKSGLHLLNR